MQINAIILAAGRGSRMGRLTQDIPKCLVQVGGRTLLAWQLESLRAAGITDISVVRGYCAERLKGDGYSVMDNPMWATSNMVSSLQVAAPILRTSPCIVSYADIVYHPKIVQTLIAAEGDIVISYDTLWETLWTDRFGDPLLDAESFCQSGGTLTDIGRKPVNRSEIQGQYMGLLRFMPRGWTKVEHFLQAMTSAQLSSLDMTSLLRGLISHGVRINAIPVSGNWCEIDSEKDLVLVQDHITQSSTWGHDWRWQQ